MHIIKEGKVPKKELQEITCSFCDTVFEFYISESTLTGNYLGKYYCYTIKCPMFGCNKIHDFTVPTMDENTTKQFNNRFLIQG